MTTKDLYTNSMFINEYKQEKFRGMQTNTINWIASLDNENRQKLCDAINKKGK